MPYKNILVGYDDSPYSRAALLETISWAKAHGSRVTLVHAVFFDSEEFSISPGQIEKRLEKGRAACELAVEGYSVECDTDIEYLVREGEPRDVIPAVAREMEADLIAMGTYGRKGLRRMIMGSVTSGVIINSPCDVLVVKKRCEECTGEYNRILVPYDDSEPSKRAVGKVADIADADRGAVTIIYVVPRYEEMVEFFRTSSIQERIGEEARKVVLAGERIAYEKGITASTVVEQGNVADKIIETAKGLESDLIVMGSHGWHGIDKAILGSTTERVIVHASVPVLVVR